MAYPFQRNIKVPNIDRKIKIEDQYYWSKLEDKAATIPGHNVVTALLRCLRPVANLPLGRMG